MCTTAPSTDLLRPSGHISDSSGQCWCDQPVIEFRLWLASGLWPSAHSCQPSLLEIETWSSGGRVGSDENPRRDSCNCPSNQQTVARLLRSRHSQSSSTHSITPSLVATATTVSSNTNSINYFNNSLTLSHHAGRSCMHVLCTSDNQLQTENLTLT